MTVGGLLLAAGAGRRLGRPKALVDDWLPAAATALREGGCDRVLVVLGAQAERAAALVPDFAEPVLAPDWDRGMGASLAAGLAALQAGGVGVGGADAMVEAAVVTLVDLPDVGPEVVARLLASGPLTPGVLLRASYAGRPGHPVVLGRDHWAGVCAAADGDRGARDYLRGHPHGLVECGDLATGVDVDRPEDLPEDLPGPAGPGGPERC